ncbi:MULTISPECIES: hypothetical protein [unclassified Myroides]|uniref:hypothetical protein n=1 Tax=unclassified Myroides TaxID=2642485 RepID=UPI003D2F7A8E
MKKVLNLLLISLLFLSFSCQKDDVAEIRSYAEDSRILQNFVSIDKKNLTYYLNLNAKSDFLKLLPTSTINQLDKVSEEHFTRFKSEISQVNAFLQNEIKNGASYVEMNTTSDRYFKEINTNGIHLLQKNITPASGKLEAGAEIGNVFFYRTGEASSPEHFMGKDHVNAQININGSINSISATLLCHTGTSPQGSANNSSLLVLSSMSGFYSGTFNWVNNESGDPVNWTFEGKLNTADFSVLGYATLTD